MSGFYRMHRGWMDNPALGGAREAFCRRAAWCWMIERAAWKAGRENIGGKTIRLERGQLTASLRYMARAWGWSDSAVRRFIERLKTDAMIDATSGAGQLVITIRNYTRYQADTPEPDAASDAAADTGAAQDRHKREEGNKERLGGGGGDDDAAEAVARHFAAERERLWPDNPNFAAPRSTLATQARGYLDAGATPDLIIREITRVMQANHAKGDPNPPTNLGFCSRSLNARIATARKNTGGSHARPYPDRRAAHRNGFCAIVAEGAGADPDPGPLDGGADRNAGRRHGPEAGAIDLDPADWRDT